MERVAGIQTGGSERAFDLYMKARYLHQQHPGHGVTFATGTPISNTMVEMYTMQRYLDPEGLAERGIDHFDAWAATFGEVVDTMEICPGRQEPAAPQPLCQVHEPARTAADVPRLRRRADGRRCSTCPARASTGDKATVIACPMSEEQRAHPGGPRGALRGDPLREGGPREDNALAITTDGRKLALDARLLSATAEDFPGSKINALVENVAAIWQRTAAHTRHAAHLLRHGREPDALGLFASTRRSSPSWCRHGIPRQEIAAIGDADTDAKKQALFERVRAGAVRVLLGSTQKMGTGTNVQKRLVALHHLDAPWKPAEVEQRDGRILRQGKRNEEVAIYRYVTRRLLRRLHVAGPGDQGPVHRPGDDRRQHRAPGRGHRRPGALLRRGEGHRLGQPGRADARRGGRRAAAAALSSRSTTPTSSSWPGASCGTCPATSPGWSAAWPALTQDIATAEAHATDPVTIGTRPYSRHDALEALAARLHALRLCRKFCSGGREGAVAPVGGEIRRPGSRTVRPQ